MDTAGKATCGGSSPLLDLPDAVQHEVLSWCPDSATANALLNTCRTQRLLRFDAAATALLLVRCPNDNHSGSLDACAACTGGASAVVQHLLQLLRAGPASGGPHTAPPALLQAMLKTSCAHGDVASVRGLLELPQPPDVNFDGCSAFCAALMAGPHMPLLRALLNFGADPLNNAFRIFGMAAVEPGRSAALELLLQHYDVPIQDSSLPPKAMHDLADALDLAVGIDNATAVALLLPALATAGWHGLQGNITHAAEEGSLAVLRVLVGHTALAGLPDELQTALVGAVRQGHTDCATLLLDNQDASAVFEHLLLATVGSRANHLAMVRLLMARGARPTSAVRAVARLALAAAHEDTVDAGEAAARAAEVASRAAGVEAERAATIQELLG